MAEMLDCREDQSFITFEITNYILESRNKTIIEAKQLDLLLPCQIFQEIHKQKKFKLPIHASKLVAHT